jgi:hypothetical protein
MKTTTLKILDKCLKELNKTIKDHVESLLVGKKMLKSGEFTQDGIDVIREKLSAFNAEKRDILQAMKWVKAIKKEDIDLTKIKNAGQTRNLH